MRFLFRLAGFLLLAVGFVTLIVDGTRAIADNSLAFTNLGPLLGRLLPSFLPQLEPLVVENAGAYLWDPVLLAVLDAPAFVVMAAIGSLFLWIGKRPPEPIGFSTRY